MNKAKNLAHHEKITQLIIESIEAGAGDFEMPWYGGGRPKNVVTGKPYKGTNSAVLTVLGRGRSSDWGTFRQWTSMGGKIKKGSSGAPIFIFKPKNVESKNDTDEEKSSRFYIGSSYVFNRGDVEGVPEELPGPTEIPQLQKYEQAHEFVRSTGAVVKIGGYEAFYSQTKDYISMPDLWLFKKGNATEAYFSVLLHELVHWTGSKERLDRFGTDTSWRFGSEHYAREELTADVGAAFLCSDLNISTLPRPDHAQYIESWLRDLKNDPTAFSKACTKAEAAVSYLMELTGWEEKSLPEAKESV